MISGKQDSWHFLTKNVHIFLAVTLINQHQYLARSCQRCYSWQHMEAMRWIVLNPYIGLIMILNNHVHIIECKICTLWQNFSRSVKYGSFFLVWFRKSGTGVVFCCSWILQGCKREQEFIQYGPGFERLVYFWDTKLDHICAIFCLMYLKGQIIFFSIQVNIMIYSWFSGNIRVYCRIRPSFSNESKTVIDFFGEDGSLVILDPLKPQKDGRKVFQFNRLFGPTATQGNITWNSSNLWLLH